LDIVLDKSTATEGQIKITLKEKDYQPKVEEKVKDYSKKANIKGFRPGKVPPGLIKKLYGKSILLEEINEILSKSITDYIKENKIKLIGEPLPNHDKTAKIDWENQKEFEFEYEIGLVAEFDLKLAQKLKAYEIEADKKAISDTLNNLRKQYGNYSEPDEVQEGDDLFGALTQESSNFNEEIWITANQLKAKEAKKFVGLKKETSIDIDPRKVFIDEATAKTVLRKSEEEFKELKGLFNLKINKINRVESAELNQDFFDKVFGKDMVKSEEEFHSKLKETLERNYNQEARNYTYKLIQDKLLDATKIEVPDEFYRKWILVSQKDKITEEDLNKDFDNYIKELKWSLIINKVAEENDIKVEHKDVVDSAKELIKAQFASYGMSENLTENLDAFAENYLQGNDGQNYMNTFNKVRNDRIMEFIYDKTELSFKKVNPEEFSKIVSN
jgi:trigger factor